MDASMVYQSALSAALAAPVDTAADWVKGSHGLARIATSDRGAVYLKNAADRLREFAETVRKNWAAYGGGAKPAELVKPKKARAAAWPTVTVKVWRELIEAGEYADAFDLGAEKLGMLVFSSGRAAFAIVAPLPVEGLPDYFASGRRDDGKFVVFDTVSGVAIGASGAASRKAAEESAREMWGDRTEEQHAVALRSARSLYNTPAEVARAAWLSEHGIACDAPAAPEPIAEEIQPADDAAPVSDCMAAIIEAARPDDAEPKPEPIALQIQPEPVKPAHPLDQAAQHLEKRRAQLAAADPAAVGFMRELVRYAERDHAELAAAFAVFDTVGDGAELSTADGRRHCVLLPDAAEPGRYRYSIFGARGFYSHSTHDTAAEAVADAARAGFTVAAPGILDRLAATQEWAHGSAVAAVMQQHNSGRILWADACAEFDRLAAQYAKPAEPAPDDAPAEPIAPDAPPVPAAPAARDLSIGYSEHIAYSNMIGIRPMSFAQWVRNNTPKPAAPNPGKAGRAAHPGHCSARRPGVPMRIKPAAPMAAHRIRADGIRPHLAPISWHLASRPAAVSRGAARAIGCAGLTGRAAPPAAPGPGVRAAAGAGPPG